MKNNLNKLRNTGHFEIYKFKSYIEIKSQVTAFADLKFGDLMRKFLLSFLLFLVAFLLNKRKKRANLTTNLRSLARFSIRLAAITE